MFNELDVNLFMVCMTLISAIVIVVVSRRYEKFTEAVDKARQNPQFIREAEKSYAEAPETVKVLLDGLNTAISYLHRSVPADSVLIQPIRAVDEFIDEVMDDIPAADKVTVTMSSEPGTSVEIISTDASK